MSILYRTHCKVNNYYVDLVKLSFSSALDQRSLPGVLSRAPTITLPDSSLPVHRSLSHPLSGPKNASTNILMPIKQVSCTFCSDYCLLFSYSLLLSLCKAVLLNVLLFQQSDNLQFQIILG